MTDSDNWKTVSVKVRPGLREEIETYQEEHDMTRSEALRHLLRTGLDGENRSEHAVSLPMMLMFLGALAMAAQYATATGFIGPGGVVLFITGFLLSRDRVRSLLSRLTG